MSFAIRESGTFSSWPRGFFVAGVKIASGKPLRLHEARRQAHAAHGARLAVLRPARPGQVPARDALERHDLGLLDENGAPLEEGGVGLEGLGKPRTSVSIR